MYNTISDKKKHPLQRQRKLHSWWSSLHASFLHNRGNAPRGESSRSDWQTTQFLTMSSEHLIFSQLKAISDGFNSLRGCDSGFNLFIRRGRWPCYFFLPPFFSFKSTAISTHWIWMRGFHSHYYLKNSLLHNTQSKIKKVRYELLTKKFSQCPHCAMLN